MTDNYLFTQAASKLAKRPVKAFLREPIVKGAAGICYIDHHGQLTVEVKPGRDDDDMLGTLIHEAMHARFNHVTEPHKREVRPGAIDIKAIVNPDYYTRDDKEYEVEGSKWFWLSYAEKHAHKYTGSWLEKRLKALWLQGSKEPIKPVLSDFDRMINDMINQAATKAAEAAWAKVGL